MALPNYITDSPPGIHIKETTTREDTQMAIIHITRPELTAEERAKRMEAIKAAAVRLVVETERKKARDNAR